MKFATVGAEDDRPIERQLRSELILPANTLDPQASASGRYDKGKRDEKGTGTANHVRHFTQWQDQCRQFPPVTTQNCRGKGRGPNESHAIFQQAVDRYLQYRKRRQFRPRLMAAAIGFALHAAQSFEDEMTQHLPQSEQ